MSPGAARPNIVWTARYYLRHVVERRHGKPLWQIEKQVLGKTLYERYRFFENNGYLPNLSAPRTFNEKVSYRKLKIALPNAAILADKCAVRDYVAGCGHADILTQVFYCGADLRLQHLRGLPRKYVIKATHGSGWNRLVPERSVVDASLLVSEVQTWLASVYGGATNEDHYLAIPPRVIIEEYLTDGTREVPRDFKFFVFHGKCLWIQIDDDRSGQHRQRFYNRAWQPQVFNFGYELGPIVERPAIMDRMIEVAESLAGATDFLRVDLYLVNDTDIRFGEITVTPNAGWSRFVPTRDADEAMGREW